MRLRDSKTQNFIVHSASKLPRSSRYRHVAQISVVIDSRINNTGGARFEENEAGYANCTYRLEGKYTQSFGGET